MLKVINIHGMSKRVYVACSGGVDSMSIVDFFRRGYFDIELLFFHHGTENSENGVQFLRGYSKESGIVMHEGRIEGNRLKGESPEEYWRRERYGFLSRFSDRVVMMGHHLDDCVETWVMSSMHGNGKVIPYCTGNYIRPMLLNRKSKLIKWCMNHKVPWVDDISNGDNKYSRNLVRNVIMPEVMKVNPGIHKVIWKKVMSSLGDDMVGGNKKKGIDNGKRVVSFGHTNEGNNLDGG